MQPGPYNVKPKDSFFFSYPKDVLWNVSKPFPTAADMENIWFKGKLGASELDGNNSTNRNMNSTIHW